MTLLHSIYRVNEKVEKLQEKKAAKGVIDGDFPTFFSTYPSLTEFCSERWNYVWHNDRNIDYYRSNPFWLSKQLFVTNVLIKKEGKIYTDLEYYTLVESVSTIIDNITKNDRIFIEVNNQLIYTKEINNNLSILDFNYVLMIGDYLTVYLESGLQSIAQIKYRVIG